jgi:hypothetical protein
VRCPRCGNDNPDSMRFCGMCGGTLLASPPPPARADRGAAPAPERFTQTTATATRPLDQPQTPPRAVDSSPSISGPSFLGLGDAHAASRKVDARDARSRNLDYLLDDEEHHRGGGAGKFFFIVFALLLAVGLGYLRWKNQLPWLDAIVKKPAPAAQTSDNPAAENPAPAPPNGTPPAQTVPNQPAASTSNPPAANQPATGQPGAAQPEAAPQSATPATSTGSQPPPDSEAPKSDGGNAPDTTSAAKTPPSADPVTANDKSAAPETKSEDSSDDTDSAAAPEEAAPKSKSSPPSAAKPRAASKPVDSVADARKYLYGRGAAQDCDRGMRILKPMANQGNPKAMVEMGALYSAGLCAPHDLPTAYRWFAIALRKDPSNQAIQTDLQKLWGEMTQPERQLAIKLTQ